MIHIADSEAKNRKSKNQVPLVATGIEGVDDLLYGGVAEGNMLLVHGAPGIEFEHVDQDAHAEIRAFLHERKIQAYIPQAFKDNSGT